MAAQTQLGDTAFLGKGGVYILGEFVHMLLLAYSSS